MSVNGPDIMPSASNVYYLQPAEVETLGVHPADNAVELSPDQQTLLVPNSYYCTCGNCGKDAVYEQGSFPDPGHYSQDYASDPTPGCGVPFVYVYGEGSSREEIEREFPDLQWRIPGVADFSDYQARRNKR